MLQWYKYSNCLITHLNSISCNTTYSHKYWDTKTMLHLPNRRLRLPQRHNAPRSTEPQPNSTHPPFRVLNFRYWFGGSCFKCTKGILHCGANEGAWPYIRYVCRFVEVLNTHQVTRTPTFEGAFKMA